MPELRQLQRPLWIRRVLVRGLGLPSRYQGTVQAVHPKTASFDLVIGVGYALRVLHMRTSPVTQFAGDGARLSLADLKPGDIVRAECRMTPTGLVADRVEKVEPSGSTQERMQ